MDWFTIEQMDETTYVISEYQHWEQTHCYLLLGQERALLVDTGTGVGDLHAVVSSITNLPITVITTHVHWDHMGGHHDFQDILVHKKEVSWLNGHFPVPLPVIQQQVAKEVDTLPEDFDIASYRIYQGAPTAIVRDGDVLDLGNRQVHILHTPGHSPGHICLLDEASGYLMSGDLLYAGTLYAFYPSTDPATYLHSLERLAKLDAIRRILPGHNTLQLPDGFHLRVLDAFRQLQVAGKLKQGQGVLTYDGFSLQL